MFGRRSARKCMEESSYRIDPALLLLKSKPSDLKNRAIGTTAAKHVNHCVLLNPQTYSKLSHPHISSFGVQSAKIWTIWRRPQNVANIDDRLDCRARMFVSTVVFVRDRDERFTPSGIIMPYRALHISHNAPIDKTMALMALTRAK